MTQLLLPRGYKQIDTLQHRLQTKPESEWLRNGRRRTLRQFRAMAKDVPAYKAFLKKRNVQATGIKTSKDISKIPTIDKDNYLRAYPRPDLCWDGKFAEQSWVISTTSGSTGEPYYFPRTDLQDEYLTVTTELYLRTNFSIQNKTTLYIDAFPMGAWIGGVYTYESIKQVAEKGYQISIITPGIHKQEVISAVKQLGHEFDQIIIGAYAPFLKDILDDGTRQGIRWTDHEVGFVFSAEAFTETFRDYVFKTVGTKDVLRASLNHYGTVDLGTMAHETPLSILIRRLLVKDNKLNILFPEDTRQPTFAQYNPELFYFESENNNLLCSSFSGLPLVRYDLKDYGGVISMSEVYKRLKTAGYDIQTMIERAGIGDTVWNLPFVYVYERNDFSVSYYAFLVYPDTIRRALQSPEFTKQITGKFTMVVDYDKQGQQRLNIHVEKKHGVGGDHLAAELREHLHARLTDESSEYREVTSMINDAVKPHVHIWEYEDPTYFRPGTKQKWVVK